MTLSLADIQALIQSLNDSDLAELTLESGEFKLRLKKPGPAPIAQAPVMTSVSAPAAPLPQPAAQVLPPTAAVEPNPAPAPAPTRRGITINAPMVGTFYRASSPEASAFVEVGDNVRVGQTVCIIEAMKLMNELESEVSGRVARFLVENGEPVEYGQPLIELEPA